MVVDAVEKGLPHAALDPVEGAGAVKRCDVGGRLTRLWEKPDLWVSRLFDCLVKRGGRELAWPVKLRLKDGVQGAGLVEHHELLELLPLRQWLN